MPVYIYEPDAFLKMVEIEGPDYRREREYLDYCSFDVFLEEWIDLWQSNSWFPCIRPKFGISVGNFSAAIYGYFGWNRYIVLNTGEITLHRYFSTLFDIKKAEKVGFRIFPDCMDKK